MQRSLVLVVVFLVQLAFSNYFDNVDCQVPKDSGTGVTPSQKYYFNEEWQLCFSFKYNGKGGNKNRFNTLEECEKACRQLDANCFGPRAGQQVSPIYTGLKISQTVSCPKGYSLMEGEYKSCCNKEYQDAVSQAYDEKCPNGGRAGKHFAYFVQGFAM